jgi:hypothetical protein
MVLCDKEDGEVIGFFADPGDGIHDITVAPNGDVIVGLLSGGLTRFTRV